MKKSRKIGLLCSAMILINYNTNLAVGVPANAEMGSMIQYQNGSFHVLEGKQIGEAKVEYDAKENDIFTYADDTNILHVYSKDNTQEAVSGKIIHYLYHELPLMLNLSDQYVFLEKSDKNTTFLNLDTTSLAVYDLDTNHNYKEKEISPKLSVYDKKFNSIYKVKQDEETYAIKTGASIKTSLQLEGTKGVYYEYKR